MQSPFAWQGKPAFHLHAPFGDASVQLIPTGHADPRDPQMQERFTHWRARGLVHIALDVQPQ